MRATTDPAAHSVPIPATTAAIDRAVSPTEHRDGGDGARLADGVRLPAVEGRHGAVLAADGDAAVEGGDAADGARLDRRLAQLEPAAEPVHGTLRGEPELAAVEGQPDRRCDHRALARPVDHDRPIGMRRHDGVAVRDQRDDRVARLRRHRARRGTGEVPLQNLAVGAAGPQLGRVVEAHRQRRDRPGVGGRLGSLGLDGRHGAPSIAAPGQGTQAPEWPPWTSTSPTTTS
jgi:hypothetical protein